MRINALGLVVLMIIGAPLSFKVEDVKIEIYRSSWRQNVVRQPHLDIFDRMREGAVISVLALTYLVREAVAELGLILVFVI